MVKNTPKNAPIPPDSLGKAGKKFWKQVTDDYALEDAHHLRLLENACLCLDRIAAARVKIEAEGITTVNRFGETIAHPAANIERQSISLFRQNIRELGLDLESPSEERYRGPRRPGTRAN